MESHQITQSFVSLGPTLLTAGMPSPLTLCLGVFTQSHGPPSCLDCNLNATRMAYWKVPVWHYLVSTGPKCVHRKNGHCGLVPGPSGALQPPRFMTQMERGPAEDSAMFGLQGEWSRPEAWRDAVGPSLRTRPEEILV